MRASILVPCLAAGLLLASHGGTAAETMTTADLNGDGRDDLVAIDADSGDVVVMFNTTDDDDDDATSYAEAGRFAVPGHAVSVMAADVDGDGRPDLLVTDDRDDAWLLRNMTETGAGTASFADAVALDDGDTMPDPFTFTDQADVERSTSITSDTVTIRGIGKRTPISVVGGRYSIDCTSTFTASAGSIRNGQGVCVRHTSSADFGTATDTTLTVGGVSDTFTSITTGPNTLPDAFAFVDVRDVPMNTPQVSNTVAIAGVDGAVPIEVSGGEYSIGCDGTFTAAPGSVESGDGVCVRHTSAASLDSSSHTTLTVGGRFDTFSTTTRAPTDLTQTGALGLASGLLGLLAALGVAGRRRGWRAPD
jgi:hypothetical protein